MKDEIKELTPHLKKLQSIPTTDALVQILSELHGENMGI
jgi:hypothetical protein